MMNFIVFDDLLNTKPKLNNVFEILHIASNTCCRARKTSKNPKIAAYLVKIEQYLKLQLRYMSYMCEYMQVNFEWIPTTSYTWKCHTATQFGCIWNLKCK